MLALKGHKQNQLAGGSLGEILKEKARAKGGSSAGRKQKKAEEERQTEVSVPCGQLHLKVGSSSVWG